MNPDLPYPARRMPVGADNLVATSQPLAAQAGVDALRRGGNAADAALAAAITLTVVEPTSNGIGSDAFALVHDGKKLYGLNASGRAPQGWSEDYFSAYDDMPLFGWDAVTVPGAVSAWVAVSERFGKLPFETLFEHAVRYAREGFIVGTRTAWHWQHDPVAHYQDYPDFAAHFLPAPGAGARARLPDAATTLEEIASTRGESFYRGRLAERIADAAASSGAVLSLDDLNAHRCDWVEPIGQRYRDVTLHEIPPNGQGLAALIALGILAHFEPPPLDSADSVHLQIEAMKIALRAAADHIADVDTMRLTPAELLDVTSLAKTAAGISNRAAPLPPASLPASADTVYLTAADQSGMMVSFIQSNFYGFGSGIVIPGTGIAMQNRGAGFSLEPGHANVVAPGKHPFHTIIPAFLTRNGDAYASFGVMGGPMQAQGHVQMVVRMVDHGQNPQAASDAPRWQVMDDFSVLLEPGFPKTVADNLAGRGHDIKYAESERPFGGAQLIVKTEAGYIGGSDHRKEGQVAGF